ncbi:hypothetical protein ACVGXH_00555, partial [Enterobacter intestinihominis]
QFFTPRSLNTILYIFYGGVLFFYKRLGFMYIVVVKFIVYYHSSILVFIMRMMGVGVALGARLQFMEKGGAGGGFSSITTIGIMFGQNMHPDSDLVFSDLYR